MMEEKKVTTEIEFHTSTQVKIIQTSSNEEIFIKEDKKLSAGT